MDSRRSTRRSSQVFVGSLIIIIGILFTLDNLNLIDASHIFRYWPVLLVVLGIRRVQDTQDAPGRLWGGMLILLGALLLLDVFGVIAFRIHDWWPLILVGVGGSMLLRSIGQRTPAADPAAPADSTVNLFALLGGFERTNSSQDFRGGSLTAVMGGCDLDLRRASTSGEVVIDIFALWGGVTIKIPEDWSVSVQGMPVMGAIEDKTHPQKGGSSKLLVVKGIVLMGGAEISN